MPDKDNHQPPNAAQNGVEDKGPFLPREADKSDERDAEFPFLNYDPKIFKRLRVILVEVKYPGNIGQAARVLHNFGYSRLGLVKPRCRIDAEAEKMAVGCEDLLDKIDVFDSIEEALRGVRIAIGTTRRRGVHRRNVLDPKLCGELIKPVLSVGDAAVLFGAEDHGLTNEDLEHCHWIASIPSVSENPSFNLSHAVAIFLYEITYALLMPLERNWARHENYEAMFDSVEEFLGHIGFLHEQDQVRMMLVIRQMLYRARYSEREVRIIRGILRQTYWRMANPKAPAEEAPPPPEDLFEDSEEEKE